MTPSVRWRYGRPPPRGKRRVQRHERVLHDVLGHGGIRVRRLSLTLSAMLVVGAAFLAAHGSAYHPRPRDPTFEGRYPMPGRNLSVGARRPAYHRIRVADMSLAVPSGWREAKTSSSNGTTTWTAQSSFGSFVELTASPPVSNPFQLLPMLPADGGAFPPGQSPYETASVRGNTISQEILGRTGVLYSFSVQAVTPRMAQRIWRSWTHPPVSSVAAAVKLIETLQRAPGGGVFPDYARSFGTARDGWIMVGAMPGAGQEAYVLFETRDGGRNWSLERYTVWGPCAPANSSPCTFPGLAGSLSMTFWNSHDGAVVQATTVLDALSFYRTQNGGRTWTASRIPVPHPANTAAVHYRNGRLLLTIRYFGPYPSMQEVSTDGGITWVPVPSPSSSMPAAS